jgi:hypothetical protein
MNHAALHICQGERGGISQTENVKDNIRPKDEGFHAGKPPSLLPET